MRLYICQDCGGIFEREEVEFTDQVPYANEKDRRGWLYPVCPRCGSDDIGVGDVCDRCEAAPADTYLGDVCLCRRCKDYVVGHITRHVRALSEEEGVDYETAKQYVIGWSELNW